MTEGYQHKLLLFEKVLILKSLSIFSETPETILSELAPLMKEEEGVYELAKMAVTTAYRGKGISRVLIEQCLSTAKEWKARKLSLFSNHQLTTALALYEKYGFRQVEVINSPFTTADVKMELLFE